jgi:beta-phosphoglucomutase-like phosphatase (HAD superfamily)
MINTVLFDMDGLLLDTEPLWGVSMLKVANKHKIPITGERLKTLPGCAFMKLPTTGPFIIHGKAKAQRK